MPEDDHFSSLIGMDPTRGYVPEGPPAPYVPRHADPEQFIPGVTTTYSVGDLRTTTDGTYERCVVVSASGASQWVVVDELIEPEPGEWHPPFSAEQLVVRPRTESVQEQARRMERALSIAR